MSQRAWMIVIGIVVALAVLFWFLPKKDPGPDGSQPVPEDRNARADDGQKIVYLKQHWEPKESVEFYFTSQGSQILPYDWFLVLEGADGEVPLRDDKNMRRFGYLLQKPDEWNPDGLPVGFVKDDVQPRAWL